ncbi:MAG: hypothetical protein FJ035_00375 [Chloroflexi bacterium]|nr:hypothetical protein [Chloroflexota bacterium]
MPIAAALPPGTVYWLVHNTNAAEPGMNDVAVAFGGGFTSAWRARAYGSWPSTFGSITLQPDTQLSIRGTHAPAGGGGGAGGGANGTLGHIAIGDRADSGDASYITDMQSAMGRRAGTVQSMSVYVRTPLNADTGDRQFQLAVYSNTAGNEPGTLIGRSAVGTLTGNAWNQVTGVLTPGGASVRLATNTTYWLVYNTNADGDASNPASALNNMAVATDGGARSAYNSASTAFGT